MNRKEFFEKIINSIKPNAEELAKIRWAYFLSKEVHRRQKRDEGERYFEHCRRVAFILIDHGKTNVREIITALLHDSIEDGYILKDMLEMLFGKEISDGIEAVSKCENIADEYGLVKKVKKHIESYYFNLDSSDIIIRRVKVADRLDNLKTMSIWSKSRQRKYLLETKIFISPLLSPSKCDDKLYNDLNSEVEKLEKKGGG